MLPVSRRALEQADLSGDEYERLHDELVEYEVELATIQADLAEFSRRYASQVGVRMAELDRLQAEIARLLALAQPDSLAAQLAAARAAAHAAHSSSEQRRFAEAPLARKPGPTLKQIYRRIARRVHPDRAGNELERTWRTQMMAEANHAYQHGDEESLLDILAHAEEGLDSTPTHSFERLGVRISATKRRIQAIQAELRQIYASRMFELQSAVRSAQQRGRDLLQEMVDQLDAQIAEAKSTLLALAA